jgi:16S rRNA (adenine1518-N6/adenine1519-N6)-dimethyltransferase
MTEPLAAGAVRELARRHNIRPSKALGQNFVMDPNTIRRIVRLAEVGPSDRVLEVGAGFGTLTLGLASAAKEVVAVEFDRALMPALEEVVSVVPNVRMVEGDAMQLDYEDVLRGEPHTFVSNLPYSLAVPLITKLLEEVPAITKFVATVQREVGERLVAEPGSKSYAAVSLLVEYYCARRTLGKVSPNVFWPKPSVWSVIVELVRRPPPVPMPIAELMPVVWGAFSQRRKTIRNSLAAWSGRSTSEVEALLREAEIDPGARAERLSIHDFARIAEAVS